MSSTSQTIYEKLVDEEDARACRDIPDSACRETPRNFLLLLLTQFCTKVGDAIASPKIVLAWAMGAVQAPVVFTGLLVPIRESGSLIPQLVIASWVRQSTVRKWFWVAGSVVQAVSVGGMAIIVLTLEGIPAGVSILACLIVFSLARGLCSVASKDVIGKTVPKRQRGQLTGWAASVAGLATVGVGAFMLLSERGASADFFAPLLVIAALLWLVGALVFSRVVEFAGETEGGRNALRDAIGKIGLLVTDAPFRRFVMARALLLCSALSAPYYVLLARSDSDAPASLLGLFLLAAGIASLVSGPVWGRFADRSSKHVMIVAALVSGGIGIVVFGVVEWLPSLAAQPVFFPFAYFVLSIAHDGVRVGRKTYVLDLAGGNKRKDYVAVSNSVIGIVLLIAGLSGALASVLDLEAIVLLLSLFGLAGAWLSTRLDEID